LAALAAVDTALKTTPILGYCPSGAQWVLTAEDVGTCCSSFLRTREGREALKAFGDFIGDFQQEVRRDAGIRPTLLRWRVWMGNCLMISSSPEGIGATVRPGVLLRVTDGLRRFCSRGSDSIASYAGWHYAWHRGFLVFSRSEKYVQAVIEGQAVEREGRGNEVRLRSMGPDALAVTVRCVDGIPVSGSIRADIGRGDVPLTLPEDWPGRPLLSLSVRKPAAFTALARALAPWFRCARNHEWTAFLETVWKRWDVPPLPDNWASGIDQTGLALIDVELASGYPIPILACVMRKRDDVGGQHPFQAVSTGTSAYPAEWNGQPGLRIPWLGESVTLCLGRGGRDWLVTTREPAMALLASTVREGTAVDADAMLRLYWEPASRVLRQSVRQAPQWKLLPGTGARDADRRLGPVFDFMSKLGKITVNAQGQEDGLVAFEGFLAQPVRSAQGK